MRKLHHLALSPFCRKVRLVLAEKKLEVELIDEPVWEKRLDFIRFSPSGKVPLFKEGANVLRKALLYVSIWMNLTRFQNLFRPTRI